ncbi:MAG: hypothetical protein ACT4OM_05125 [Actinomycetota bacterium]
MLLEVEHIRRLGAHLEWSPSKLMGWAATISADTASVVSRILEVKPHPEQGYRLARMQADQSTSSTSAMAMPAS